MAEKESSELPLDVKEEQFEHKNESKSPNQPSALELESLGGLRTIEVGFSADQVVKNEEFDRKE